MATLAPGTQTTRSAMAPGTTKISQPAMLVADAEEESHMIATTRTTEPETLPETSATGTQSTASAVPMTPQPSQPTRCAAPATEEKNNATIQTTVSEIHGATAATGTLAPNRTAEISTPMISLPTLCVARARAELPRTSKDVVTGSSMAKLTQEVTDAIGTTPGQDSAAIGTMMTSSPLETAVPAAAGIVGRIICNHAYPPAVPIHTMMAVTGTAAAIPYTAEITTTKTSLPQQTAASAVATGPGTWAVSTPGVMAVDGTAAIPNTAETTTGLSSLPPVTVESAHLRRA